MTETGEHLFQASENLLGTVWMHEHLYIAVHAYDNVDALDRLEQQVLHALVPPLNLKHVELSPLRKTPARTTLVSICWDVRT